MAKLSEGGQRGVEGKPTVSPADIAFLVVVFLLICATLAVSEGLVLGAWGGGSAIQEVGGRHVLRVVGFPDGHIEIEGHEVSLEMVRPIVESAAAGEDRLVVVAEYGAGTSPGLVSDVVDSLRATRVKGISVRRIQK